MNEKEWSVFRRAYNEIGEIPVLNVRDMRAEAIHHMRSHLAAVHKCEVVTTKISVLLFEHAFAHGDSPNSFGHEMARVFQSVEGEDQHQ